MHYLKLCKEYIVEDPYTINEFVDLIKSARYGRLFLWYLGPVYGTNGVTLEVDQISKLINGLRYKPMSTEHG
jgi:hypothetical protein